MRAILLLSAVLVLPFCAGEAEKTTSGLTALDEYVRAPDPSYSYELVRTLEGDGYTAHVLKMTSQTWRSTNEVDRTLWRHWLTVIEPVQVTSNRALLYITGGRNDRPAPEQANPKLWPIAVATNSVVVELRMVPNQPLTFSGDPGNPRREDALIAYAWDQYLRGGDEEWLPRLPMTKSVVRAMDTVTDFFTSLEEGSRVIDQYVVAGASKRGWTAWTTAAVDDRVVAIVPIVIDLLNMDVSFQHHYRAYGSWSPAIKHYEEMGITEWIGTDRMHALREIVEPYAYRFRLTMPKLLINAAGDEFFLPDSSRLYFDDLEGEKYLRYVPNAGHSLRGTDYLMSLLVYYQAILTDTPRPEFSWTFEPDGSIHLRTVGSTFPTQVLLWEASNPDARDFRIDIIGKSWTSSNLSPESGGLYKGSVEKPEKGWTAFFLELTYPAGPLGPFKFTTDVRVVPDTLPFSFKPARKRYASADGG